MLDIEIDGKQILVPPGSTIMDAARQADVYIPHFCYHKKLSIAANCRMCLVEVEKAAKPLPACATPVSKGMKVFTHSKLAVDAQKGVMEFLLLNHPLDCPICDQGGECQLQDLAVGYGTSGTRYAETKQVVFHKEVGPLISMQEMSRCIFCTRCVRFGQEIGGVMELGMANRNVHSEIQTFMGQSVDSELSGNMIDLCPVGALTSKPFRYSARSWELARRKSVSPHDSLGANLVVQVKNNRVMRVLPRENEAINECWLSDKDRFSYEGLNSTERLTRPMIRVDGSLREVEWSVALDYVAHGLKDIVKTHGADSIASLCSPHSTLEELYLMQKLMRALGSGNIDSRPRRKDFSTDRQRQGVPWLGLKIKEIQDLDSVLVLGSFLRKDHPLLAQRLRQLGKTSAKVSLITVTRDNSLINLHAQMVVAPDGLAVALGRVLKAASELKNIAVPRGLETLETCEASRSIAQSLVSGTKQAIFLGNIAEQCEQAGMLHSLAECLAKLTGARFGFFGEAANSVGAHIANAIPSSLNAYEMFAKPRKAYVLMGVEPELDCHNPQLAMSAIRSSAMTVMLSSFKSSASCDYADVLLPIAPFTETSGTFINTEGYAQSFSGVCQPLGETRPAWKVLRVLGNLLDLSGFGFESSEEVCREMKVFTECYVDGLSNALNAPDQAEYAMNALSAPCLQRIAPVPIYSADSLVRRGLALQKTTDAKSPSATMSSLTLKQFGLTVDTAVRIQQGSGEVVLKVKIDEDLPFVCAQVSAAHPATACLGDMFGSLTMEQA